MKKLLGIMVAVFFVVLCSTGVNAAELKVGSVNLQKALNECQAGKEAITDLDAEVKRRQEDIDKKQEELKKLNDELEKKKAVWNEETRDQKQKELQAKMQEFQRYYLQSNEDIKRKEQEKKKVIVDDLIEIVKKLGKEKGYTLVFEAQNSIIYSVPDVDLTDEVIKRFNSEHKKGKKE